MKIEVNLQKFMSKASKSELGHLGKGCAESLLENNDLKMG